MTNVKYKFIPHTADIKFKIYAGSLNGIFNNCALVFCEIIGRGQKVRPVKSKRIKLSGKDNEALLYKFIDEMIYLLDAKHFLVCKAKVKIDVKNGKLEGEVYGDSAREYKDLDHIKAATYSEMYIKKLKSGGWESQVVVDV